MPNIKTGLNFVTAKVTDSFESLQLNQTNVREVYTADSNGNPVSWRPDKAINTLSTSDGIIADKGYMINAKIDFENLFLAPPFVSPATFALTKTNNSITVTIDPLWGANSFRIDFISSGGGGSANQVAAAPGNVTTKVLSGLNPSTTYTVYVIPIMQGNIESTYTATPQTVTTDA